VKPVLRPILEHSRKVFQIILRGNYLIFSIILGNNSNNNGNEDNDRANGRNRMNNAVSDEQFGKVGCQKVSNL
jgi:hypothetical protein